MSLAARRLRSRPAWRVADLVARLAGEGERLSQLVVTDVAVRAAFALSYEYLDEQHRMLWRRLAAHPGPDFCQHSAAAVVGLPAEKVRDVVERLVDEHLLDNTAPGRYRLHDLLALFARERFEAEEPVAEQAAAVRRSLDWYLHTTGRADRLIAPHRSRPSLPATESPLTSCSLRTRTDCHAWYDAEQRNLAAAMRLAVEDGHDDIAWKLPIMLWSFCQARQSWLAFRAVLATAHTAVRRSDDRIGDAWVHNARGICEALLDELAAAEDHFHAAARISRENSDPVGEGRALNNLGECRRKSGDFTGALTYYRRDLALSRARTDMSAVASSLNNIGKAEFGLGDVAAAIATYTDALDLARTIGDTNTEAEVLTDLGAAAAGSDRNAAIRHYRASADVYRELGDLAGAAAALTAAAETSDDPPLITALVAGAQMLLPGIDEPFAGRTAARLDRILHRAGPLHPLPAGASGRT